MAWLWRLIAFAGPGYMVSVGYMDPGNWATDIAGGSRYGYALLWVLVMSNLMAILLQTLGARLGIVTGRDLAQACRESYPRWIGDILWVLIEIAIAATDLAEVLGTAIGLNLLFGLNLIVGVIITGFDALLLLVIQHYGIRKMEAFILLLISGIGMCFVVEIFLSHVDWGGVAGGFVPILPDGALYVAIGIIGATVMPHNLYLHSALVQSRAVERTEDGMRQACRFNLVDSVVALNGAFFVNAAILVVSAAAFWSHGIAVTEIQQAHSLLDHMLGSTLAPVAFALALVFAGQSSTLTGTLAGQIVMEGFLHIKLRPWVRRFITRAIAIIPAVAVIIAIGDAGTYQLLILSQVILSLQLPFAIVPLLTFTNDPRKMGAFTSPAWVQVAGWVVAALIIGLNMKLVSDALSGWYAAAGAWGWLVILIAIPIVGGLLGILAWMIVRGVRGRPAARRPVPVGEVVRKALAARTSYRRIGLALDFSDSDAAVIKEGVDLARSRKADIVLIHVVEGAGGQWYGSDADDQEAREDRAYLDEIAGLIRSATAASGEPVNVEAAIGYGNPPKELTRMVAEHDISLLIVGKHGHKFLADMVRGQTIPGVRHGVDIPLVAVPPLAK